MTNEQHMEAARLHAIVLTCQRYAPIAAHMIGKYETIWPDHPFVFRVPDGSDTRERLESFGHRIEFLPTHEGEGRGRFRQTVFDLLSGIDDEEWVYWCIDDKYPISLDVRAHNRITSRLRSLDDVDALQLCRVPPLPNSNQLEEGNEHRVDDYVFQRRLTYHRIWVHQFVRAKVLRSLFGSFPEVLASAKEMDPLKDAIVPPSDQRLYVSATSLAVFGESTMGGVLTTNCARSLQSGPGLPAGFEVSPTSRILGGPLEPRPGWTSRSLTRFPRHFLALGRKFRPRPARNHE